MTLCWLSGCSRAHNLPVRFLRGLFNVVFLSRQAATLDVRTETRATTTPIPMAALGCWPLGIPVWLHGMVRFGSRYADMHDMNNYARYDGTYGHMWYVCVWLTWLHMNFPISDLVQSHLEPLCPLLGSILRIFGNGLDFRTPSWGFHWRQWDRRMAVCMWYHPPSMNCSTLQIRSICGQRHQRHMVKHWAAKLERLDLDSKIDLVQWFNYMNYMFNFFLVVSLWFMSHLILDTRVIHQSRDGTICMYLYYSYYSIFIYESFCCWVLSCLDLIDYVI